MSFCPLNDNQVVYEIKRSPSNEVFLRPLTIANISTYIDSDELHDWSAIAISAKSNETYSQTTTITPDNWLITYFPDAISAYENAIKQARKVLDNLFDSINNEKTWLWNIESDLGLFKYGGKIINE